MKKISIITIIISAFFIANTSASVLFLKTAFPDGGSVVYSCGGVNYKSQNDSAYQACVKKEQEEKERKAEEERKKQEAENQKIKEAEL